MRLNKFISFIASLTLLLTVFLSIVDYCCFDSDFYIQQYQADKTAVKIGVSEEGLERMTEILLQYLKGERDNIDGQEVINGQNREIFDQREKLHMKDVLVLYNKAIFVRNISFLVSLILFIYIIIKRVDIKLLFNNFVLAFIVFIAIFSALGLYAFIDFDAFWTNFHQMLFTNDLWLLDPNTEIMINMVPASFFSALVMRILKLLFICYSILIIIFLLLRRRLI